MKCLFLKVVPRIGASNPHRLLLFTRGTWRCPATLDPFLSIRNHLTGVPRLLARHVPRHGLPDHKGDITKSRKRGNPACRVGDAPLARWWIKWFRIKKKGSNALGGLIAPVKSDLETAKSPGTWGCARALLGEGLAYWGEARPSRGNWWTFYGSRRTESIVALLFEITPLAGFGLFTG